MRKYYIRRKKDPDLIMIKSKKDDRYIVVDVSRELYPDKYISFFTTSELAKQYMSDHLMSGYKWEIVYKDVKKYE